MISQFQQVTVLGAGVIGLSTATVLSEAGYRVKVVADRETPNTTSDVAAAFWYPFHVEGYSAAWAVDTYNLLKALMNNPASGVTEVQGKEYFQRRSDFEPWLAQNWWTKIDSIGFRELPSRDIPKDFDCGVLFRLPVVHMPTYMGYLHSRFLSQQAGGEVERRHVVRITDELTACDVLVNCTGLGSRTLEDLRDEDVYACQGQVVVVRPVAEVDELIFITTGPEYEGEPLYIVPRNGHDIILGGTTRDHRYDVDPVEAVTRRILERCSVFCPALLSTEIVQSRVGLRPARRGPVQVRADGSHHFSKPVFHNYGHGGAGVTLSWGCAHEVLRLLQTREKSAAPHLVN